ncbi:spermidine acetyltransferase [Pseudomonas aeruginosa]|nr:spermidine acetyltransferase [Pseudomonas aeruginosa]
MIELRTITRDDWETCIDLKVARHQAHFVASNLYSLAQSRFLPGFRAVGIHHGGRMVGFALYGPDADDGHYWLYRLMIDRRYQGKGHGRAALQRIIASVRRTRRRSDRLMVAYAVDNDVARQLYRDAGFVEQGLGALGRDDGLPDAAGAVPSLREGRRSAGRACSAAASRRRIAGFGSSLQYL